MEEITLTSRPSALEVQKAAEMLLYENLSDEEWGWAVQIIKAYKEGQK